MRRARFPPCPPRLDYMVLSICDDGHADSTMYRPPLLTRSIKRCFFFFFALILWSTSRDAVFVMSRRLGCGICDFFLLPFASTVLLLPETASAPTARRARRVTTEDYFFSFSSFRFPSVRLSKIFFNLFFPLPGLPHSFLLPFPPGVFGLESSVIGFPSNFKSPPPYPSAPPCPALSFPARAA